ncbi:hypothetical protein [Halostreptopolyspora alba]
MSPTLVLADSQINSELVTPGVLGFLVIAAIGSVLYLLMKSMIAKLHAVRGDEPDDGEATGTEPTDPEGEQRATGDDTSDSDEPAGGSDSGETTRERDST